MSRPKRHKIDQDEDAAKLQLGPDFDGQQQAMHTLNIGEVKYLLEQRLEGRDRPQNEIFKKTLEYVSTFAKFATLPELERVNQIFSQDDAYNPFELAQMANLCPTDTEEAKALIPSLQNKDDDMLQALLTELESVRQMAA